MRKKILSNRVYIFLSVLILFGALGTIYKINKPNSKKDYKEFLANHEYNNRAKLSPEEYKAIPKKDRPDLAWEQNFLMTMDPALGYPPVERLIPVFQKVKEMRRALKSGIPGEQAFPWEDRGPNNVGGRVRAVMFDPNDATNKKVWAGSVSGGLWYNDDITDANSSWKAVDNFWSNIAISCIAYDPSNKQNFYVGTGEGWNNADAVRGQGVWKTTDGGTNWNRITTLSTKTIQKIAVTSTGLVLVGADDGLYYSENGGNSWTKSSITSFVSDIEIATDGTIYAATGKSGIAGSINKSSDGKSWTSVSPSGTMQRIELAIAPSNSSVIYAVASQSSNVSWLKKSINGGSTWSDVTIPKYMEQSCSYSTNDFTRGQAWYDLILAVHPTNPDIVIAGGIDLSLSTNGGTSWETVSYWTGACKPEVHADQHAIVFRPGNPNEAIFGNDGGIYYSKDIGSSTNPAFEMRNKDFNITQFYAAAIHPDLGKSYFLAGAQDNGSQQFKSSGVNSTKEVTGGDGAFCFIDQLDPNIQITSYVNNNYYISKNGGNGFSSLQSDNSGSFINPTDYDDNKKILFSAYSTSKLNRISNIADNPTIKQITVPLGSDASHIVVSPHTTSSSTLFVGTRGGDIYKVTNADGSHASTKISKSNLPDGTISCIDVGVDENELVATFSNYGVKSIWYTNDGGANWIDKEGDLPDMPVRWVLFNPNNRKQAIIATEVGVWSTKNLDASAPTWIASNSGLANVRVDMLQMRKSDNEVIAATHGRGLFSSHGFSTIDYNELNARISAKTPTSVGVGGEVEYEDLSTGNPTSWLWTFEGGTPATSTEQNPTVKYETEGIYDVTLKVTTSASAEKTETDYVRVGKDLIWIKQATGFAEKSRGIKNIHVVDKNVVWAVAYDGSGASKKIKEFTKTTDGGKTWTPYTITDAGGDVSPAMIAALDGTTAWTAIYPNSAGAGGGIYKTTNGGTSWTKQTSASFTGSDAFANVVYFWDKDNGFCMGDPNGGYFEIYTTNNGGTTWTRTAKANIPANQAEEYGTVGLYSVGDNGIVFFPTTKGRIFKSSDKGKTWTVMTTPINGSRIDIAFADEQNGLLYGGPDNSEKVYTTTDGGDNWTIVTDDNVYTGDIKYVNGTEKMYVSCDKGASYSVDGGNNWIKYPTMDGVQCLSIGFSDMSTGWIGRFNESATEEGILKYVGTSVLVDFGLSALKITVSESITVTDKTFDLASQTKTYEWNFGADASPASATTVGPHTVNYSTEGEKTITLSVNNGEKISKKIKVETAAGIYDISKTDNSMTVYPNPNNGQFNIKLDKENKNEMTVRIFSISGKLTYSKTIQSKTGHKLIPIDLHNKAKGIYTIQIISKDNVITKKVMVE